VAQEIEAAAVDGAAAFLRRKPKHALPLGSPCPNCATPLEGPWCHVCGQSAEDYHRSILRLTAEAVGGLFEVDGRLWRTLPDLFFNPARLTRSYLDGHRAPQAPPFRTFLIVVVLAFLAMGATENSHAPPAAHALSEASMIDHEPAMVNITGSKSEKALSVWLTTRIKAAMANQATFGAVITNWAQRLVILALPISAVLLGLMFFWRRGVFMFDHLIFSMHSLSFQGLLLAATVLLSQVSSAAGWLVLASPTHLFFHLKGTYRLGVFGTLIRMLLLFIGSAVGFAVIVVALLLIGLYEIGG
jgi:hypothetical protein